MLLYRDLEHGGRRTPPPWCMAPDGTWAPNLVVAEDANGRLWGIGDSPYVGAQPPQAWRSLAQGWEVALVAGIDPGRLQRPQRWCDTVEVEDLEGNAWAAPVILLPGDVRAFRVRFGGPQMLPVLSPEQTHAEAIAKAARQELARAAAENLAAAKAGRTPEAGIDMQTTCTWAAELLALVNFVSIEVIQTLALLDEALVVRVLMAATGHDQTREEPRADHLPQ